MGSRRAPTAAATATFAVAAALLAALAAGAANRLEQAPRGVRPSSQLAAPRPARRPPYRLQRLPVRIASPVYATAPPGSRGRIYVVQRAGIIRIVSGGRIREPAFLDIRDRVGGAGEQGMFSLAFHPQFATNGLVYVCYTDLSGAVVVAEYRSSGDRAAADSARVLVRVPHGDSPYHNGGQIAFAPDRRLYVGIGDGGYLGPDFVPDPHRNAQNLSVLLGKIFALDVSVANHQPQLVAYGLRNPWRFSRVPRANAFVVADVGWNSAEEVNYLRLGRTRLVNFGWSVYEGRSRSGADSSLNRTGELTWPIHTYQTSVDRNCSITGGFVYRGSVRALRGRYVFGDYCSGRIWSLRIVNGRARGVRRERLTVPGLASFGEDARGELYAVSIGLDRLFRLVPR
jgi:glucose/arabinose dehydrogenase